MASLQPSKKEGTSGCPCALLRKVKRSSHHVLGSCSPSCRQHGVRKLTACQLQLALLSAS